jgi:predicted aspartyl protease
MPVTSTIDGSGSVRLNVELIGTCSTIPYSAIFDSGFNGDIVLPIEIAVAMGLESGGVTTVELADGFTQDFPIFLCEIDIGGIKQNASVIIMGNEVLLGMGLMDPFDVCMRVSTSEVRIEPQGTYVNFVGMLRKITEM